MTASVITRYPPSPTGEIHIGNMRTMLFNYLWAKQHDGQVVLRFEDTDTQRSDAKYESTAIEAFNILGINPDQGPFRQSERTDLYTAQLSRLIDSGHAYIGEPSSDGSGKSVVRFKNPNTTLTFTDLVRGDISIDTTDFGDFVIARSLDDPIYHFTVVVDDIDMGITHILRGEDHITSTPRQILLIEALGGTIPQYAHLPLIIGDDKKKLSKRHGAVTINAFMAQGYLPAAIINYLALLGWNPGDEREIFSLSELITNFSIQRIQNSPAMFDYTKLDNINRQHILQQDAEYISQQIVQWVPQDIRDLFDQDILKTKKIIQMIIMERIKKFSDVTAMADRGEFAMFYHTPTPDPDSINFKDTPPHQTRDTMQALVGKLQDIDESAWHRDSIKESIWQWTEQVGRGSVLHPMRMILSGEKQSPDPFTIADIIGKSETINRLQQMVD